MNRVAFSTLVMLFVALAGSAQSFEGIYGAAAQGMNISGVAIPSIHSGSSNPGALAGIEKPSAGLFYGSGYMASEMSTKGASVTMPLATGVFSLTGSYYGYSLYNEQRYSLAYGKTLGQKFSAGISLDYCMMSIGNNYGTKGAFTFGAGMLASLNKELTIGGRIFNPFRVSISKNIESHVPSLISFGLAYRFSQQLTLSSEIEKNSENSPVAGLGFDYSPVNKFHIRGGFSVNPGTWSFGIGFKTRYVDADIAAVKHPVAGFAPQISVICSF